MRDHLDGSYRNAARLEALRHTSLLDSPPEEAFDRLTRLARSILRVPRCLRIARRWRAAVLQERRRAAGAVGVVAADAPDALVLQAHGRVGRAAPRVGRTGGSAGAGTTRRCPELGIVAYAGIPLDDDRRADSRARSASWTAQPRGVDGRGARRSPQPGGLRHDRDRDATLGRGSDSALSADLQHLVEARTSG